jgi:ribosomal protein S18 acetylase RimI-like enzyme
MPEAVDLNKERAIQNIHMDHLYSWEGKAPVIRHAELPDLDRIMEIENTCFPGHLAYPRKHMYYLIFRARSFALVEECEGIVRGYVIVLFRKRCEIAGIESIGVDPYHRGSGTGMRLLSAAEKEMTSRGIRYSTLQVSAGNCAALNMYETAGYRLNHRLENYYRYEHHGTRMAYGMTKDLLAQDRLK